MKKSVLSALAATLVLGAASTTFAAPVDDEVAALKARVAELERMIQEQNRSTASRRDVANLDSRVADLESSKGHGLEDRFNIGGELRYRYWNLYKSPDISQMELRLLPTFKIDDHFAIKARFTGSYRQFHDDAAEDDLAVTWAYLEAKYDNFQLNAGKLQLVTQADNNPNSGSLVADDTFSGIQVVTGKDTKFYVNAGHWAVNNTNYIGAEALFNSNEKLNFGLGYHYGKQGGTNNKTSIIAGGVGFKLNEDWGLYGAVAHNTEANSDKTAYNIEAAYKGADRKEKASWGAYAAYRYAPSTASIRPTYDTFFSAGGLGNRSKKGFELGATWTPYQNTLTRLAYFHGKTFGGANDRTLFARASIFF